jgi:hypothetical protein
LHPKDKKDAENNCLTGENMADLKGCPFGQDIKGDCKTCDYGDTNHFDAASGKCVKR